MFCCSTQDLFYQGGIVQVIDSFLIPPAPIFDTLAQYNLTGFGGALVDAALGHNLSLQSDLTMFAPSNTALQGIGSTLTTLDSDSLLELLKYHIVNTTALNHAVLYSTSLTNGTILPTLQGGNITIRIDGNSLYLNSAQIIQTDITLANGVVHVLDNVLDPNATGVLPVPQIPTQVPVILGSSLKNVPFTKQMPSTGTTSSSSSAAAASSSFAVSELGSAATSTADYGAAASSTGGSEHPQETKKSAAVKEGVAKGLVAVAAMIGIMNGY